MRNNSGGTVPSYEKILPLLYTNPVVIHGSSIWATQENIVEYGRGILDNPKASEESRKRVGKVVDTLKKHIEELVVFPDELSKLDTVYTYPSKIAIIINANCASATELFVLHAKQSTKVTVFGQPTMGAVDYLDITDRIQFPCESYVLHYPLSRNNRLSAKPIPTNRISPNVTIPDKTNDWIEFVKTYWKQKQ